MNFKKILFISLFISLWTNAKSLEPVSYWDIQSVSNPEISSDNKLVLFSKRFIDKQNDEFESEIWIMDSNGEDKRFFLEGSNPKWSSDNSEVAFIKADENDVSQIFIKDLESQTETQITNVDKGVKDFAWSPDDKKIAFSVFNEYESDWKIDIPGRDEGNQYSWTEDPNVVTTMHWKSDGRGEWESGENHLFLVSSDGGPAIKISDWGLDYVGDIQWMDNENLLFTGNDELNDLLTPWKQTAVFVFNTKKSEYRKISPNGVFSSPRASIDGKKIIFIGHPSRDYSSVAFDVWIHESGRSKQLTKNLSSSPRELLWLNNESALLNIDEKGAAKIFELNTSSGKMKELLGNFKDQFYLSSTSNGSLYGVYSNPDRPGEIASINKGELNVLSEFNELVLSQYNLGKTHEINYKSKDKTAIQGWYITPPEFDKKNKYPLILVIHGGPHAMYRPSFNYLWHQFASDGYVVLYTNPRGSTGYGSEFANIIDNDYPGAGDLSDLLAGVDFVVDKGFIDESKMYVQGCSGGGVLTAWVVGHDDRFAAAASLCPVTNWISMVGTTDIPAWTFEWFDKPFWEDPTEWLEHSPIMKTGDIKTPTLFMTGVLDIRTPMAQTEEMYIALKQAGVETALVRMNQEWHGTGRKKPTNWFRTYGYLSEWYEKYQK